MTRAQEHTLPPRPRLPKLLYTIGDACEVTGLGRSRLYVEMQDGRLKWVKVGTRRMIRAEDLQDFVNALTDSSAVA